MKQTPTEERQEILRLFSEMLFEIWRENPYAQKALARFIFGILWVPVLAIAFGIIAKPSRGYIVMALFSPAAFVLWYAPTVYTFGGLKDFYRLATDRETRRHNEMNPVLFALVISILCPVYFVLRMIFGYGGEGKNRDESIATRPKD